MHKIKENNNYVLYVNEYNYSKKENINVEIRFENIFEGLKKGFFSCNIRFDEYNNYFKNIKELLKIDGYNCNVKFVQSEIIENTYCMSIEVIK